MVSPSIYVLFVIVCVCICITHNHFNLSSSYLLHVLNIIKIVYHCYFLIQYYIKHIANVSALDKLWCEMIALL